VTNALCVVVCTGASLVLVWSVRAQDAPPASPPPTGETSAALQSQSPTSAPEPEPPPPAEPAIEEPRKGWGELIRFTSFWENDGAYAKPRSGRDDHYTSGLKLDFAWKPEWAQDMLTWVPFSDQFGPDPQTAFGLSVQQLMFTPEDLSDPDVVEDDRPYAGWLSFNAYWQRSGQLSEHIATFDHFELDAGVVGQASGAEALQTWVHNTWPDQEDPQGWSNQIPDTLALDLTIRKRWRFSTKENDDHVSLQFLPSIGGTLGTVYRQLDADAMVRIGWNIPNDFGPTSIADVNAATGGWSTDFGVYVYGRLRGTFQQHNIFLDGPDWGSAPHTVDSEPFVGDFQFGVVALLWKHFEIGYSLTYLTDEFEGQQDSDSYGAITLGYRASF